MTENGRQARERWAALEGWRLFIDDVIAAWQGPPLVKEESEAPEGGSAPPPR